MNEARFNPRAQAAAAGQQLVRYLDIGDGFALIGTQLVPRIVGEDLVISILAIGGKNRLVGFDPKPAMICDIARAPLGNIRRALAGGEAGSDAGIDTPTATDTAEPDTSSSLILGGPLRSVP